MSESTITNSEDAISQAVAEGGTYDLIRNRLLSHVDTLETATNAINAEREQLFGQTTMELVSRVRMRTENNCVPRDIVCVGDRILFGYNVFFGLKRETQVSDVFAAYRIIRSDEGFEIVSDPDCDFITDERFLRDFRDLYAYYKDASLARMQVQGPQLVITFKVGDSVDDVKVFHWRLDPEGKVNYVDDRGERVLPAPAKHTFEWRSCGRDDLISRGTSASYSLGDDLFAEIEADQLQLKIEDNTDRGAVFVLRQP